MIDLLSNDTIDKIAAGEVVEKPVNIVKELIENSIDAGSTAVSVEIKGGGTALIRVTDNGCGISESDTKMAFTRHATSKLHTIDDLDSLVSLGFRGEALSSIAAVSRCELITKQKESLLGTRVVAEGGRILENSPVGAPNGTTFISRALFYNVPARKKFLKPEASEGAHIAELLQKFSLSRPDISFQFISNGTTKLSTSGDGDLSNVVYRIFGKEVYSSLLPVDHTEPGISIKGLCAKPEFVYRDRNGEIYFINGRIVTSKTIRVAIEEVYRNYLMQHQFPFCVLDIHIDPASLDVNVHPRKAEVKFDDDKRVSDAVMAALNEAFDQKDLIPTVSLDMKDVQPVNSGEERSLHSGPSFVQPSGREDRRMNNVDSDDLKTTNNGQEDPQKLGLSNCTSKNIDPSSIDLGLSEQSTGADHIPVISTGAEGGAERSHPDKPQRAPEPFEAERRETFIKPEPAPKIEQPTLFDVKLLSDEPIKRYRIIGQVFDTYWLITLDDNLYIVDQHAAHEKINYEHFVKRFNSIEAAPGQRMEPPLVVSLSPLRMVCLERYISIFEKLGFEIEDFGSDSVAIRAIPLDLYGFDKEELFLRLLEDLSEKEALFPPTAVMEKLASMSCKAAIKGNMRFDAIEMENLMTELMTLDNPYNCPHGRPVFIRITKEELEKKFKRIV